MASKLDILNGALRSMGAAPLVDLTGNDFVTETLLLRYDGIVASLGMRCPFAWQTRWSSLTVPADWTGLTGDPDIPAGDGCRPYLIDSGIADILLFVEGVYTMPSDPTSGLPVGEAARPVEDWYRVADFICVIDQELPPPGPPSGWGADYGDDTVLMRATIMPTEGFWPASFVDVVTVELEALVAASLREDHDLAERRRRHARDMLEGLRATEVSNRTTETLPTGRLYARARG